MAATAVISVKLQTCKLLVFTVNSILHRCLHNLHCYNIDCRVQNDIPYWHNQHIFCSASRAAQQAKQKQKATSDGKTMTCIMGGKSKSGAAAYIHPAPFKRCLELL